MSKLSLYKRNRQSKDYTFIDKQVRNHFEITGTIFNVHKYLGPKESSQTTTPTEISIQDVLFLENRDRNYDKNVIELKGMYTVNDLSFNLSQFNITLNDDVVNVNFHINQMIDRLGRKLMAGDVLEIEHRREDTVLDETIPYLNTFFVVEDASRLAESYSATWFPHIWRIRGKRLTDSQEYESILSITQKNGKTLQDIISNAASTMSLNDLVMQEAADNVPTRNFNSGHLYIRTPGESLVGTNLIDWQFNGDGIPDNTNIVAESGTRFPSGAVEGDYFLRTDYSPPSLFKRHGSKWCVAEVQWRDRPWSPAHRELEDHLDDSKTSQLGDNPNTIEPVRQAISKVINQKLKLPEDE